MLDFEYERRALESDAFDAWCDANDRDDDADALRDFEAWLDERRRDDS